MNIFVDTNILLDVLANREPFYAASARIWSLAECGEVIAYISVISYNNVYYVVRKIAGKEKALEAMKLIRGVFKTVAANEQVINQSIDSGFGDFEDAIQYYSAARIHAKHLITRNPRHFPESSISILSPDEFLAVWNLK